MAPSLSLWVWPWKRLEKGICSEAGPSCGLQPEDSFKWGKLTTQNEIQYQQPTSLAFWEERLASQDTASVESRTRKSSHQEELSVTAGSDFAFVPTCCSVD